MAKKQPIPPGRSDFGTRVAAFAEAGGYRPLNRDEVIRLNELTDDEAQSIVTGYRRFGLAIALADIYLATQQHE